MTAAERIKNLFFPVLFVGVVGSVSASMIWQATHRAPAPPAKPGDPHWERSFKGTWKSLAGDRLLKLKWHRSGGSAALMRGELSLGTGTWSPLSATRVEVRIAGETLRFVRGIEDENSGVMLYVLAEEPAKSALLSGSFYRLDGPENDHYVDPLDFQ